MQGFNRGLHVGHGGRHQGGQAHELGPGLAHSLDHALGVNVAAQVEHVIAVIFQNNADDVLADIMYIALDRGNDDLAFAALGLTRGCNLGFNGFKSGLGSGGSLQKLRQEHGPLLKAVAHGVQRGNQRSIDHIQRLPQF